MFLRWFCCALVAAVLPASAAESGVPDAHAIVVRMAARDRELQTHRKGFDYDLEITREKLGDHDEVTSSSKEKMVVQGDDRPDFGTRSSPGAPEDEAKKASREEPFELLNILDHYNYALEGEETMNGVLCYRIAFTPKPDMPYDNREEKVLNAVAGHLWASTKDYSLVRNEGALLRPVPVAWVFASLEKMNFHFDASPLPNGDYGPREEQYSYLVSIPFFTLHERDTRQMSNYRRAGEMAPRP
jgi:hypothetical protein